VGCQNSQSLKQIGVATSERFRGTFVHFIVGFKLYQILHTLYLKINGYTLKIYLPVWFIKMMDKIRRSYFWKGSKDAKGDTASLPGPKS
jgi:hypothetical protein